MLLIARFLAVGMSCSVVALVALACVGAYSDVYAHAHADTSQTCDIVNVEYLDDASVQELFAQGYFGVAGDGGEILYSPACAAIAV